MFTHTYKLAGVECVTPILHPSTSSTPHSGCLPLAPHICFPVEKFLAKVYVIGSVYVNMRCSALSLLCSPDGAAAREGVRCGDIIVKVTAVSYLSWWSVCCQVMCFDTFVVLVTTLCACICMSCWLYHVWFISTECCSNFQRFSPRDTK